MCGKKALCLRFNKNKYPEENMSHPAGPAVLLAVSILLCGADSAIEPTYRIPDPLEMKGTSAAEGVAVDAKGVIYGGEVGPRQLARHNR